MSSTTMTEYTKPSDAINFTALTRKPTARIGPVSLVGLKIFQTYRKIGENKVKMLKISVGSDVMKLMGWLPGDSVDLLFDVNNRLGCIRRVSGKDHDSFTLICNTPKDRQEPGKFYSCRLELRLDNMNQTELASLLNGIYPVGTAQLVEDGYAVSDGYRFPLL